MESGTSIKHKAAGSGGLPELIGHLEEKAVQYAIFAVENPKGEPRYVLMTWIGPNVSKIKKSKTAANHDGVLVLSGARPAPPRPAPSAVAPPRHVLCRLTRLRPACGADAAKPARESACCLQLCAASELSWLGRREQCALGRCAQEVRSLNRSHVAPATPQEPLHAQVQVDGSEDETMTMAKMVTSRVTKALQGGPSLSPRWGHWLLRTRHACTPPHCTAAASPRLPACAGRLQSTHSPPAHTRAHTHTRSHLRVAMSPRGAARRLPSGGGAGARGRLRARRRAGAPPRPPPATDVTLAARSGRSMTAGRVISVQH